MGYTVLFAKFPTQEHKKICLVPVPDDGVDDDDDGDDDDEEEEEEEGKEEDNRVECENDDDAMYIDINIWHHIQKCASLNYLLRICYDIIFFLGYG